MNKTKLINFETKIADLFNNAKIKAPVHLYSNNEDKLIKIFKKIGKNDWVFCSWRSHYQCLLKGVPTKLVEKDIMDGIKKIKNENLFVKKLKKNFLF